MAMVASNMSGHIQKQLTRSLERILEEAHLSGELKLSGRKLKDFPKVGKTGSKYSLSDTVIADEFFVCACPLRRSLNRHISSRLSLIVVVVVMSYFFVFITSEAPIFISCFLGLRRMAECPVYNMKEGGLWWFTDLTVPDPYYILLLITAATLALTIEIGTDSARAQAMGMMRYVFRALPVVILPFTLHFPGAILCYWVSSNFISKEKPTWIKIQVGFLRFPKIRTFFKIEPLKRHPPKSLVGQKGFVEGFKSSWSNMKATREMNARQQVDEVQFHQAGRGPLRKTYPYDPTKQTSAQPNSKAILAKKR